MTTKCDNCISRARSDGILVAGRGGNKKAGRLRRIVDFLPTPRLSRAGQSSGKAIP